MTDFREYTVFVEQDVDGFYVGEVVELPGCHTQAKTVEELMERWHMFVYINIHLSLRVDSIKKAVDKGRVKKINAPNQVEGVRRRCSLW